MKCEELLKKIEACGAIVSFEENTMDHHGETYYNGYVVDIIYNGGDSGSGYSTEMKVSIYADDKEELVEKLTKAFGEMKQNLKNLSGVVKTDEKNHDEIGNR